MGTGCNLPLTPTKHGPGSNFQSLLLTLSQTEARRKAPAALTDLGARGDRSGEGEAAVATSRLPVPPPPRPPASSTGASTAQTLGYKATLPNTHRGAPPGRGGRAGTGSWGRGGDGIGPPPPSRGAGGGCGAVQPRRVLNGAAGNAPGDPRHPPGSGGRVAPGSRRTHR